jgi:hypothetical protein
VAAGAPLLVVQAEPVATVLVVLVELLPLAVAEVGPGILQQEATLRPVRVARAALAAVAAVGGPALRVQAATAAS